MELSNIFREFKQVQGSASDQTVYTEPIKAGRILRVEVVSVQTFTTAFGDYVTAKYVAYGIEHSGIKYLFKIADINATYGQEVSDNPYLYLGPNDRLFFTLEATAATTTHQILIQGVFIECPDEVSICDVGDHARISHGIGNPNSGSKPAAFPGSPPGRFPPGLGGPPPGFGGIPPGQA